jgi:hypothetical protein
MNARVLLNTALAMLLASTVVMAGGLIWLATAEPEVLASAHIQHGLTGVVLAVAGRALAAIW